MKKYTLIERGDVFKDEKDERYIVLTMDYSEGKNDFADFVCFNFDKDFHISLSRNYLLEMQYIGNIEFKVYGAQSILGKHLRENF